MRAYINTNKGTKVKIIATKPIRMTKAEEEKMIRKFNRETRVMEWVGGVTYFIRHKGKTLKSSSLDELQEMFKMSYLNLPPLERKCFFHK